MKIHLYGMWYQVTAVHDVMHTMKTNLANIKNVLHAWDRPLMERKPKPVDRDEFERAHKGIKTSRYSEIKEGGKVSAEHRVCRFPLFCLQIKFVCTSSVTSPLEGHVEADFVLSILRLKSCVLACVRASSSLIPCHMHVVELPF